MSWHRHNCIFYFRRFTIQRVEQMSFEFSTRKQKKNIKPKVWQMAFLKEIMKGEHCTNDSRPLITPKKSGSPIRASTYYYTYKWQQKSERKRRTRKSVKKNQWKRTKCIIKNVNKQWTWLQLTLKPMLYRNQVKFRFQPVHQLVSSIHLFTYSRS